MDNTITATQTQSVVPQSNVPPGGPPAPVLTPATQSLMELPANFQAADPSLWQKFKDKVMPIVTSQYFVIPAALLALTALVVGGAFLLKQPAFIQLLEGAWKMAEWTIVILAPGILIAAVK